MLMQLYTNEKVNLINVSGDISLSFHGFTSKYHTVYNHTFWYNKSLKCTSNLIIYKYFYNLITVRCIFANVFTGQNNLPCIFDGLSDRFTSLPFSLNDKSNPAVKTLLNLHYSQKVLLSASYWPLRTHWRSDMSGRPVSKVLKKGLLSPKVNKCHLRKRQNLNPLIEQPDLRQLKNLLPNTPTQVRKIHLKRTSIQIQT